MKKIFIIAALCFCHWSHAQKFINSGHIEFEVRTNNHRAFVDDIWADMFKDKIPQFSTSYFDFIFNDNKAIYKFNRRDEKGKLPWQNNNYEDDNIWYNDYEAGTFIDQKFVFEDNFLLSDSLMKFKWKLSPTETREIMGFNCRKATGIIFDSVYVFAFYTDEITISGGPMGINGLPGMVLGITIPRMYRSWIATKVQLDGVNTKLITAPLNGKKKKATELQEKTKKVTKDWGHWGQQAVWDIFL